MEGVVHEDAAEGHAVERPERGVGLGGDDGGGAGRVVHEGQLAEGAAGADGVDFGAHPVGARLDFVGRGDVDVEGAALDDVEVVACVALGYHFDVFGGDGFLDEGGEHGVRGVVGEVGEEEVGADGGAEAGDLRGGFGVVGGFPVRV